MDNGLGCMFFLLFPLWCLFIFIILLVNADWAAIGYLVLAFIGCGVAYGVGRQHSESSEGG